MPSATGSSDGGATSVCGGNLSDSTAEGAPPTLDAYDTDAASLVSSAHHIYQRKYFCHEVYLFSVPAVPICPIYNRNRKQCS